MSETLAACIFKELTFKSLSYFKRFIPRKHGCLLNKMYLNCAGPLIYRSFSNVNLFKKILRYPYCCEAILSITLGYSKQTSCCFLIFDAWTVISIHEHQLFFHITFSFSMSSINDMYNIYGVSYHVRQYWGRYWQGMHLTSRQHTLMATINTVQ